MPLRCIVCLSERPDENFYKTDGWGFVVTADGKTFLCTCPLHTPRSAQESS